MGELIKLLKEANAGVVSAWAGAWIGAIVSAACIEWVQRTLLVCMLAYGTVTAFKKLSFGAFEWAIIDRRIVFDKFMDSLYHVFIVIWSILVILFFRLEEAINRSLWDNLLMFMMYIIACFMIPVVANKVIFPISDRYLKTKFLNIRKRR